MNLVDRAKNIITTPKTEWPVIAGEEPNTAQIMTGYVLPMAALPAIATFIGSGFIGGGLMHANIGYGIGMGIVSFVVSVLAVFLTATVVNLFAPSFDSQKDMGRAVQLVAYSFTPSWIGGILNIVPLLGILGSLFGLYGLYLLYLGLPHQMKTPTDKVVVYLIVSIIVLMVFYFVLGAILTGIIVAIFAAGIMSGLGGM